MSIIGGNWGVYDAPSKPPRPYLEFDATRAGDISGSSWSSSPNSKESATISLNGGASYFAPENAIELKNEGTDVLTLNASSFNNVFQISGINQTPNKFSLELWVYVDNNTPNSITIINTEENWIEVNINKRGNNSGGFGTFELTQANESFEATIDVPQWTERWYHIVVSVDSGAGSTNTARVILNGKETAVGNLTETSNQLPETITIGDSLEGSIGYFALYDDYVMEVVPALYRFNINDRFRRPDTILETVIDNITGQISYTWINTTPNTLTIDWGDGSAPEDFTLSPATHTYSDTSRRYIIRVLNATGTFEPLGGISNANIIAIKGKGGPSIEGNFGSQYQSDEIISYGGVENEPLDLRGVADFASAWRNTDITSILNVNMSNATILGNTWRDCSSLTSFSLVEGLPNCTSFQSTWQNCNDLTSFPLIDTSSGTNFNSAWSNCNSLTSFPLIDTSSGTNFSVTWNDCPSLTSFPLIDTSSGTNFFQTWRNCSSLTSFPLIDTSSGTDFSFTWSGCSGLTSFPLIDTSSGTNFRFTWNGCGDLTSFPLIDTSSGTNFSSTWNLCSGLTSFPLIDTSSGTNFFSAWNNCGSLTSFPANVFDTTGTLVSLGFQNTWRNCALSVQSIENILVSLDTNGSTGITLNINGGTNAGRSTWTSAAETAYNNLGAKGWSISINPGP